MTDTAEKELDVRRLRKPDKHPAIFGTYDELYVGESFVLVNDHDPRHLRDEFENEHPRGYDWEYLSREPRDWRIRITKLASTPLPRILANTTDLAGAEPDAAGAVWRLPVADRDLDANVIALPPGHTIDRHTGPELDVLIHVLAGYGVLTTELTDIALEPGVLAWLPRHSIRQFTAGAEGLRYLTVHQRRQVLGLTVQTRATASG